MITVLGPKGGTGKTVTSSNLAVALALEGKSAVLVDLDLQFGDVGPRARAGADEDDLRPRGLGRLARRREGRRGSWPGIRPERWRCSRRSARIRRPRSGPTFLREVFEILRSRYDFVIVDTPPAFTPEVIAAVDASSHLCVVGMLDALSLKDTKIGLETLGGDGLRPEGDHARAQPRGLERRHHAARTSSSSSAARPTCSSAATARFRGHSRAASRSWWPSRSRKRLGRTQRLPSGIWRSDCDCRRRAAPNDNGRRRMLAAEGELSNGTARANRELADGRGDPGRERNGNGSGTDPFAELKNRIHLALVSELGPRLFDVEDSGAVRERVESEIADQLRQEAGLSREDRRRLAAEIADDIFGYGPLERLLVRSDGLGDHGQRPEATSGSSAAAGSRRRR